MKTTVYDVPSRTQEGVTYKVEITADGEVVCNCQGFESVGHCDHAKQILEQGGGAVAEAAPPAALNVTPPSVLLPSDAELETLSKIARTLVRARGHAIPESIDSPEKAAAVMLAGWELGLKPMTAFRHIFVVNGRTEPDAQVMMGLVRDRDPEAEFVFHEYTTEVCTVELRRPGRESTTCTYTIADAKASGQVDRVSSASAPWKKYPRDMLAWAAVKRVCRLGAADHINAIEGVTIAAASDVLVTEDKAPALTPPPWACPNCEVENSDSERQECERCGHLRPDLHEKQRLPHAEKPPAGKVPVGFKAGTKKAAHREQQAGGSAPPSKMATSISGSHHEGDDCPGGHRPEAANATPIPPESADEPLSRDEARNLGATVGPEPKAAAPEGEGDGDPGPAE